MNYSLKLSSPNVAYYHPKHYYEISSDNITLGDIFAIHPRNADLVEENCAIVGFELNFSKLSKLPQHKIEFAKISKFPTTKLDFNFVIPKNKLYKDIINYAQSVETKLNFTVSLLDIYANADGTKSYTLHYEVNSLERNLTADDIEVFHSAVIKKFKENGIELKI